MDEGEWRWPYVVGGRQARGLSEWWVWCQHGVLVPAQMEMETETAAQRSYRAAAGCR